MFAKTILFRRSTAQIPDLTERLSRVCIQILLSLISATKLFLFLLNSGEMKDNNCYNLHPKAWVVGGSILMYTNSFPFIQFDIFFIFERINENLDHLKRFAVNFTLIPIFLLQAGAGNSINVIKIPFIQKAWNGCWNLQGYSEERGRRFQWTNSVHCNHSTRFVWINIPVPYNL